VSVGVALLVACGNSSAPVDGGTGAPPATGAPAPADLVDRSAAATSTAGTARFVTEARLSSPTQTVVAARGEGVVDFVGPRGVRRDAVNSALAEPGAADELVAAAVVWIDGASGRQQAIDDGQPGRVTPVAGGLAALWGLTTDAAGGPTAGGPAEVLRAELGGRDYFEAGTDTVRGTPSTRFRSVEGTGDEAETVEVWVADDDRIVRITRARPDGAGGQRVTSLELYEFGEPADIPPTPPLSSAD
jgi:hypothetical protein